MVFWLKTISLFNNNIYSHSSCNACSIPWLFPFATPKLSLLLIKIEFILNLSDNLIFDLLKDAKNYDIYLISYVSNFLDIKKIEQLVQKFNFNSFNIWNLINRISKYDWSVFVYLYAYLFVYFIEKSK